MSSVAFFLFAALLVVSCAADEIYRVGTIQDVPFFTANGQSGTLQWSVTRCSASKPCFLLTGPFPVATLTGSTRYTLVGFGMVLRMADENGVVSNITNVNLNFGVYGEVGGKPADDPVAVSPTVNNIYYTGGEFANALSTRFEQNMTTSVGLTAGQNYYLGFAVDTVLNMLGLNSTYAPNSPPLYFVYVTNPNLQNATDTPSGTRWTLAAYLNIATDGVVPTTTPPATTTTTATTQNPSTTQSGSPTTTSQTSGTPTSTASGQPTTASPGTTTAQQPSGSTTPASTTTKPASSAARSSIWVAVAVSLLALPFFL